MNKEGLINEVAKRSGLRKKDASKALDGTVDAIAESLSNGDPVILLGFGSFSIRERSARMGRNPQTGEIMQIPASKTVGFKAGKKLKDSL